MPNQPSPWLEHQVLIQALGNPGLGPRRLAAEMALPRWGALQISATAVFNVLRRHGLNTRRRRLSLVAGYASPPEPSRPRDPVRFISRQTGQVIWGSWTASTLAVSAAGPR